MMRWHYVQARFKKRNFGFLEAKLLPASVLVFSATSIRTTGSDEALADSKLTVTEISNGTLHPGHGLAWTHVRDEQVKGAPQAGQVIADNVALCWSVVAGTIFM